MGLDFDNTIIDYGSLFRSLAIEHGLVGSGTLPDKRAVRDTVRCLPNGEIAWQCLQAQAYGPRISEAAATMGIHDFLCRCQSFGWKIMIVSHKDRYAAQDRNRKFDLIKASKEWLRSRGIVGPSGPVLDGSVFFEPTRKSKILRIAALGCDAFVDDLEESFAEPNFPQGTKRILFDPANHGCQLPNVIAICTWDQIDSMLFTGGLFP